MDATAEWLERRRGCTARILGVRLRAMTLGHAFALCSATSWRPLEESRLDAASLVVSLYVCSRDWRKVRIGSVGARWFALRLGVVAALTRVDLKARLEMLAEYFEANTAVPDASPPRQRMPSRFPPAPPVMLGTPVLARLYLFAIDTLALGDSEAKDHPLADLVSMWVYDQELRGRVSLKNSEQRMFDRFCAEQDALRAARRSN